LKAYPWWYKSCKHKTDKFGDTVISKLPDSTRAHKKSNNIPYVKQPLPQSFALWGNFLCNEKIFFFNVADSGIYGKTRKNRDIL